MASNTKLLLIAKAAKAMLRWGRSGFKTVDSATLERRENACLACPHLQDADGFHQSILAFSPQYEKTGQKTGNKVCQLCGCYAARKMRLATETCPDTDIANPSLTRWGEPVAG
jgi:hypothetical protein